MMAKVPDEIKKSLYDAAYATNLNFTLSLIRTYIRPNSEVPTFILKLYMVWIHSTLEEVLSRTTILPKEDFEIMRKNFVDQIETMKGLVNSAFDKFDSVADEKLEKQKREEETK